MSDLSQQVIPTVEKTLFAFQIKSARAKQHIITDPTGMVIPTDISMPYSYQLVNSCRCNRLRRVCTADCRSSIKDLRSGLS